MKIARILIVGLFVVVIMALVMPQSPASAAGQTKTSQTIVITEAQINASHWVTDPIRPSVSNKHVALGDGLVTISATITHRDGKVFDASSIWKPYINNRGALIFNFQGASIQLQSASSADAQELRAAHQHIIRDAIRDYVRSQVGGPFKYKNISVTPGLVTLTVEVYSK